MKSRLMIYLIKIEVSFINYINFNNNVKIKMRPTMLMFRSPKEHTPDFYQPRVYKFLIFKGNK